MWNKHYMQSIKEICPKKKVPKAEIDLIVMPNSFFTNNPFSNHMLDTLQPFHTRPLTPPSSLHSHNHSNPFVTHPLFFSHPLLSINTLSTAIGSFSFSTNNPILCSFTSSIPSTSIPPFTCNTCSFQSSTNSST